MPFVDPPDSFAAAPRAGRVAEPVDSWEGPVDVDDGRAELYEVSVGPTVGFDGCSILRLYDCVVAGVSFAGLGIAIEASSTTFTECDLSGVALSSARATRFIGCKLVGSDISGAALDDVVFARSVLRYTNFRMSSMTRLAFDQCQLDDADFYEAMLEDVAFPDTDFEKVTMEKARFTRVDFRGAATLGLATVGDMRGALISEAQVLEIAYPLALTTGADIERNHPDS